MPTKNTRAENIVCASLFALPLEDCCEQRPSLTLADASVDLVQAGNALRDEILSADVCLRAREAFFVFISLYRVSLDALRSSATSSAWLKRLGQLERRVLDMGEPGAEWRDLWVWAQQMLVCLASVSALSQEVASLSTLVVERRTAGGYR